jgi:hypothetical protein
MDLRVIHLRKVLPVTRMLDVPGPPHVLYITGPEMEGAASVEINGNRGYSWRSVGPRMISVDLPLMFMIQTVAVLGQEMGTAREAEIFFGFTELMSMTSGIQKLAQDWLKRFLTTPGTDPFSRKSGGGGQEILKKSSAAEGLFNSALLIAVRSTNEQLIARQAIDIAMPSSEKLLNAKLLKVTVDPDRTGYTADIEILSQAGNRVQVGLAPLGS